MRGSPCGEMWGGGHRGSPWLPAAAGTEARRKAAGSRQRGRRAAPGPAGAGDAEPGLPSRRGLHALGGGCWDTAEPRWPTTPRPRVPNAGGGPGTWHGHSVDVHLLEEIQGLQGLRHLGCGHVLPLPPARGQRFETESGPRERGWEGGEKGVGGEVRAPGGHAEAGFRPRREGR